MIVTFNIILYRFCITQSRINKFGFGLISIDRPLDEGAITCDGLHSEVFTKSTVSTFSSVPFILSKEIPDFHTQFKFIIIIHVIQN